MAYTKEDLIKELQEIPGNPEIVHRSDNFELGGSVVPGKPYIDIFTATVDEETFTDAFDYGTYKTKVVNRDPNGEKTFLQVG